MQDTVGWETQLVASTFREEADGINNFKNHFPSAAAAARSRHQTSRGALSVLSKYDTDGQVLQCSLVRWSEKSRGDKTDCADSAALLQDVFESSSLSSAEILSNIAEAAVASCFPCATGATRPPRSGLISVESSRPRRSRHSRPQMLPPQSLIRLIAAAGVSSEEPLQHAIVRRAAARGALARASSSLPPSRRRGKRTAPHGKTPTRRRARRAGRRLPPPAPRALD